MTPPPTIAASPPAATPAWVRVKAIQFLGTGLNAKRAASIATSAASR